MEYSSIRNGTWSTLCWVCCKEEDLAHRKESTFKEKDAQHKDIQINLSHILETSLKI